MENIRRGVLAWTVIHNNHSRIRDSISHFLSQVGMAICHAVQFQARGISKLHYCPSPPFHDWCSCVNCTALFISIYKISVFPGGEYSMGGSGINTHRCRCLHRHHRHLCYHEEETNKLFSHFILVKLRKEETQYSGTTL